MSETNGPAHLTRRKFLQLGSAAAAISLLQACAPAATPAPTPATSAQPAPPKPAATQAPAAPAATPAPTQAPAAVATAAAGPKRGGTFTVGKVASMTDFNPLQPQGGTTHFFRAIWSTLCHYDANLKIQPELAEKWDLSADGLTATFKLRQGVRWHSGREFTSADVKASIEWATSADAASYLKPLFSTIKQVETPDKYTAAFKFDTVNPGLYDILDTLYMTDHETIQDRSKTAIGTGPFRLDKYVPNDRLELVPHKDYWEQGKPYLDKYIIRQIPDPPALAVNLESGAIDCAYAPSFTDIVRLRDTPGSKFVVDPGARGALMRDFGMNCKLEPFTDKRVRQAFAHAIDRARFCSTIQQGLVPPTCLIWPRNSWGYFPDLEDRRAFNLDKAASLLKEAGLGNGFETELLCSSQQIGDGQLAQIIQADLAKIGVKAKVLDVDVSLREARQMKQDIVTIVHAYGRASRDPGTTVTAAKAWFSDKEGNWVRFESQEWDQLRKELQSTLDNEKRKATLRKIQELALDECFCNPIAELPQPWAMGSYVKGFSVNPEHAPWVGNIWLDK